MLSQSKARFLHLLRVQLSLKVRTPSLSAFSFRQRQERYLAKHRLAAEAATSLSQVISLANRVLSELQCERFNNWVSGKTFALGFVAKRKVFQRKLKKTARCIDLD